MVNNDITKKGKVFLQYAKEHEFYDKYVIAFCGSRGISTRLFRKEFAFNSQKNQEYVDDWKSFLVKVALSFDIQKEPIYGEQYWSKVINEMKKQQKALRYQ